MRDDVYGFIYELLSYIIVNYYWNSSGLFRNSRPARDCVEPGVIYIRVYTNRRRWHSANIALGFAETLQRYIALLLLLLLLLNIRQLRRLSARTADVLAERARPGPEIPPRTRGPRPDHGKLLARHRKINIENTDVRVTPLISRRVCPKPRAEYEKRDHETRTKKHRGKRVYYMWTVDVNRKRRNRGRRGSRRC